MFLISSFFTNHSFNLLLNYSSIWSLTYFALFCYNLIIFLIILYLISNIKDFINYNAAYNNMTFVYTSGLDILWFIYTPVLLVIVINFSWSGPLLTSWFGHLLFSSFQLKMTYFIAIVFILICTAYSTAFYYSSQEVYDYTIIVYSFFFELFDCFIQIIYLQ